MDPGLLWIYGRRIQLALRGPMANKWGLSATAVRLASQTAYWQVRAFYLLSFLAAFDFLRRAYAIAQSDRITELLWPVFWVEWLDLFTAAQLIGLLLILSSFAALLKPQSRSLRILVALGFLQFAALDNSFGSINHYAHYFVWISAVFVFAATGNAPEPGSSLKKHFAFIVPVFFAQALIGLFYTLSGLHKIYGGLKWGPDTVSSFHPDALPLLVMNRWEETRVHPMFADFFASNTLIAWPAYLAVIFFEATFLIAVFRPQLHKFYGFALATFHMGVWLTLGITFDYQPVLVALLFLWSPLTHFDRASLRERVAQVPVFGDIFGLLRGWRPRPGAVDEPAVGATIAR